MSTQSLAAADDDGSLAETVEILSEPGAVAQIRAAEQEMSAGQVHDEAAVRAALAARRG